jgi:uncharacterized membrane protein (Fun14 family)
LVSFKHEGWLNDDLQQESMSRYPQSMTSTAVSTTEKCIGNLPSGCNFASYFQLGEAVESFLKA